MSETKMKSRWKREGESYKGLDEKAVEWLADNWHRLEWCSSTDYLDVVKSEIDWWNALQNSKRKNPKSAVYHNCYSVADYTNSPVWSNLENVMIATIDLEKGSVKESPFPGVTYNERFCSWVGKRVNASGETVFFTVKPTQRAAEEALSAFNSSYEFGGTTLADLYESESNNDDQSEVSKIA
jgi:hypothetical protein